MEKQEYIEKQEKLFIRWKKARREYSEHGNWFCEDGIVNYKANFDLWKAQRLKILFLVKENHEADWSPAQNKFCVNKPFAINIARWRYLLMELYKSSKNDIEYPKNDRYLARINRYCSS